jgi:phosphate transport system substrate-binding protein
MSATRKCGGPADITTWGQVGMTGEWATRTIALYGRNSVSGTYGYFKSKALCKGDFKRNVAEQPGSASVVQSVTGQIGAIGYSGIGYKTSDVHTVALGEETDEFVEPSYENCVNGEYPLARFLYVYINKKPDAPLDSLTSEFLKFVISKEGQEVVVKDGYFPLPKTAVDETLGVLTK